jgi:acyl carrier protein
VSNDTKSVIEQCIREIARQNKLQLPTLRPDTELVDELGFTSLAVASLIANLEEILVVDPFQDENVMITDIRTVGDLTAVYDNCVASVE